MLLPEDEGDGACRYVGRGGRGGGCPPRQTGANPYVIDSHPHDFTRDEIKGLLQLCAVQGANSTRAAATPYVVDIWAIH